MKKRFMILCLLAVIETGCIGLPAKQNAAIPASQPAMRAASLEEHSTEPGDTPLIIASRQGNVAQVKALLASGADVNATNEQETTALMAASQAGHVEVIKELTAVQTLELDRMDLNSDTALMQAVQHNQLAAVQALLAAGADPESLKAGMSALIAASYQGNVEIVQALLDAGANAAWADENGETALDVAANNNHPAVVAVLYQHQAKKQK